MRLRRATGDELVLLKAVEAYTTLARGRAPKKLVLALNARQAGVPEPPPPKPKRGPKKKGRKS